MEDEGRQGHLSDSHTLLAMDTDVALGSSLGPEDTEVPGVSAGHSGLYSPDRDTVLRH